MSKFDLFVPMLRIAEREAERESSEGGKGQDPHRNGDDNGVDPKPHR